MSSLGAPAWGPSEKEITGIMALAEPPPERLSDYERAICYYTLPRISYPVTFGLIVAYAVCLLEAFAAVIYGLLWDHAAFAKSGAAALGAIVVFGIVVFTLRALLNEVRMRRVLAVARGVPDAIADIKDIPDPFAGHFLLRHPLHTRGDIFTCTDNTGAVLYSVESAPHSPWWKVKDAQDNEVLRVHVKAEWWNFSFGEGVPNRLAVHAGDQEIAQIRRRFTFATPTIQVCCDKPAPKEYEVRGGGIYQEKRLVGRIYYLHRSLYLDIEEAEFHEAILGLFVAMT